MKIHVIIIFLFFFVAPLISFSQAGDWSKMTEKQKKEYWKKREQEEKAHKKAVKEHWKKIGAENEVGTGTTVYKRMQKTKKTSKRINNKKNRNKWMRKNKSVNKDPLYKRIMYKFKKKES